MYGKRYAFNWKMHVKSLLEKRRYWWYKLQPNIKENNEEYKINTVIVCDSSQLMNKTVSHISVKKKTVCWMRNILVTTDISFPWLFSNMPTSHDSKWNSMTSFLIFSWHVSQPNIIYRVHATWIWDSHCRCSSRYIPRYLI